MAAPLRSTIPLQVNDGVYAPQEDSWLLSGVLEASGLAEGRRVLDICTGSGVLALEAARLGAREVLAFDLCPAAVECASGNAAASGLPVEVRLGTLQDAVRHGPFDLVVANPPYVPSTVRRVGREPRPRPTVGRDGDERPAGVPLTIPRPGRRRSGHRSALARRSRRGGPTATPPARSAHPPQAMADRCPDPPGRPRARTGRPARTRPPAPPGSVRSTSRGQRREPAPPTRGTAPPPARSCRRCCTSRTAGGRPPNRRRTGGCPRR